MSKAQSSREAQAVASFLKSNRSDSISYRQLFDLIGRAIPFSEGLIVSSMPRGGLQIVQPPRIPDSLLKAYAKDFHTEDRITWATVIKQKPLRGKECWERGGLETSRFLREFMQPHGLQYAISVPVQAPIMPGYQGALQLYRSPEQGDFTETEMDQLNDMGRHIDDACEHLRVSRRPAPCQTGSVWAHRPSVRQWILDNDLKPVLPHADLSQLDDRLRQQILQHARHRMQHLGNEPTTSDRLQLPDTRGDLWTFRVFTYKDYPALGKGPMMFFCLQPDSCDWATIRPTDFMADAELSRLIPALRFMQAEFHRSPTLGEISKQVHLSPFHFHRRFTELLGLTPKHFLLECQIFEAKRQLMARQKELAEIAADCGFAHQSHFTSRFKQATGLTPTRWRRLATDLQRSSNN